MENYLMYMYWKLFKMSYSQTTYKFNEIHIIISMAFFK